MINITKENNSLVMKYDGEHNTVYSFPLNSIVLIANDISDLINVRLKSSRMNVVNFLYKDVANITATSATDMVEKISLISNN